MIRVLVIGYDAAERSEDSRGDIAVDRNSRAIKVENTAIAVDPGIAINPKLIMCKRC